MNNTNIQINSSRIRNEIATLIYVSLTNFIHRCVDDVITREKSGSKQTFDLKNKPSDASNLTFPQNIYKYTFLIL